MIFSDFSNDHVPIRMLGAVSALPSTFDVDILFVCSTKQTLQFLVELLVGRKRWTVVGHGLS
ncbi:MAG: hypothetical protein ACOCQ7_03480, partial [Natronomonas sp.]